MAAEAESTAEGESGQVDDEYREPEEEVFDEVAAIPEIKGIFSVNGNNPKETAPAPALNTFFKNSRRFLLLMR